MATVLISRAPNRELYEMVNEKVMAGGTGPGLIIHTASETPDGDLIIVDVWESSEAEQAFRDRLNAIFADVGIAEMVAAGPQPDVYETFEVQRP